MHEPYFVEQVDMHHIRSILNASIYGGIDGKAKVTTDLMNGFSIWLKSGGFAGRVMNSISKILKQLTNDM
ncbi:hypothetical protein E4U55_003673 [Claviceps digitariae]|nr:hypothetical protein E4U55_003673 [Claviceps digitariae]